MIFAETTWQDCLMYALVGGFAALTLWLQNKSRIKDNARDEKVAETNHMAAAVVVATGAPADPKVVKAALDEPLGMEKDRQTPATGG